MKKYRVKSLAVAGRYNKIHRTGDTVFETNFPEGHAEKLVVSGHLEAIGEGEPGQVFAPDPTEGLPVQTDAGSSKESAAGTEDVSHGTSDAGTSDTTDTTKETTDSGKGDEGKTDEGKTDEGKGDETKTGGVDGMTVKEIKKELKARNIHFDADSSKEDLYKLLMGL
jgi:hypothetical protein